MILDNAKPRLQEAMDEADKTKLPQEVKFIYNELHTIDTITSVFEWIYKQGRDFATRRDEYRYVIIIQPKTI